MSHQRQNMEENVLKLSHLLQSTLEIDALLEILHQELTAQVPHMSLSYENPVEEINILLGELSIHTAQYNIVLLDQPLGVIKLTRATPFSETELEYLEIMLSALIYPVRNSLLYSRALRAAYTDPITGASNRAAMEANLSREVDLCQRHDIPMALLVLDLDDFKQTNDTYGHIAGDAVLKGIVDATQECVRKSDMVFRFGGEEFVVMLRNASLHGAQALAERIRDAIEQLNLNFNGMMIPVTASIGLAVLDRDDTVDTLLDRADKALYRAKDDGKNRVVAVLEQAAVN